MSWIFWGLLSAFSESIKDLCSKKAVQEVDKYLTAFGFSFVALFFIAPLAYLEGLPELSLNFFLALSACALTYGGSAILFLSALKHSDLSLVIPLLTFSPLFHLAVSPIMVGEFPSMIGLVGVVLIVVGSYVLNLRSI